MPAQVIIEIEDGDVASIQSTQDMRVAVLNRDLADPTTDDYVDDAFGKPAAVSTMEITGSPDVADLIAQYLETSGGCDCTEGDDDGPVDEE